MHVDEPQPWITLRDIVWFAIGQWIGLTYAFAFFN